MKNLLYFLLSLAFIYVGCSVHNKTFDWYQFDTISGSIFGFAIGMGGIIWIMSYQTNNKDQNDDQKG